MRRLFRIIKKLIMTVIVLIILLFAIMQLSVVQTYFAGLVANYLSKELNTELSISKLQLSFPNRLLLEEVYLEDPKGDTLAYIRLLHLDRFSYNRKNNVLDLGILELEEPVFHLHKSKVDSLSNLQFLIEYFQSSDSTESKNFTLLCEALRIRSGRFTYQDELAEEKTTPGIDFNKLRVSQFNLRADTLFLHNDSVSTHIRELKLVEYSGFKLDKLDGAAYLSAKGLKIDGTHINTPGSFLSGNLHFQTKGWGDWADFEKKVRMRSNLSDSELELKDLAYFVPFFDQLDRKLSLRGQIRGTVARLRGKDIYLKWDENSSLEGDFRLEGLPEFDQTFISLNLSRLTTNKRELDRLPLPPFNEGKTLNTPENFERLGQLEFSGDFTGFITEFVAYGRLDTRLGRLRSDLAFKESNGDYTYKGELETKRFDLGRLYNNKSLGIFSSALSVDGNGLTVDNADAKLDGVVYEFNFNDYVYRNIDVRGTLSKEFFNGKLHVEDENLKLDFTGEIDFAGNVPKIKAQAQIPFLDPVALNFMEDSLYTTLTAYINADIRGLDIQSFKGSLEVEDFSYCRGQDEYNFPTITIRSTDTKKGRKLTLNSPIADGSIEGVYNFAGLQNSVLNILDQVFPSYFIPEYKLSGKQKFKSQIRIKDFSSINELLIPELNLAEGTFINLQFDEPQSIIELTISSDRVDLLDYRLDSLTFDISRPEDAAYITLLADNFRISEKLQLMQLNIDGRSENDTIYSAINWDSSNDNHSGEINSRLNLRGNQNLDILFAQSSITLNETPWYIEKDAFIKIDSSTIDIRKFSLESTQDYLRVDGSISQDPDSLLEVDIKDFDLRNLNPFMVDFKTEVEGVINGKASIRDLYNEKKFLSDIVINELSVNKNTFGDLCLESSWDDDNKRLVLLGEIQKELSFPLQFGGYYTPRNEESPLDLNLNLDAFELSFLNPFLTEGISSLSGSIDSKARLTGTFSEPLLSGSINFNNVGVRIDYLGTSFFLNDKAGIYPDMFTLDYIEFQDAKGNKGHLVGTVIHDNFSNWNFDVYADLEEQPLLLLNTSRKDNPLYFGKAYGSGFVSVFGYENNLEFDINLQANDGTILNLPLDESQELAFEDFVVFVNTGEDDAEEEVDLSGIDLHFELDITPEARFKLIFDEAAGDIMQGRGRGNLNMDITSEGIFEMFGTLEVVEGDYLFTLRNLVSKTFQVERGGTISWYGDPLAAELNLNTVLKLSAPLYDLMAEDADRYRNRVPVELRMKLKGPMLNPGITFDISLPSSDELTRSRVESIISTEEMVNQQAFALLVLNRFISPPSVQNKHSALGAAENTTDFLTSQFNNWLSQISEDFDIGFNYRPGDEITNSEVALALSTQLFDDRLQISGNFGVNYGSSVNSERANNLVGDVNIEYSLTEDGKVRMIAFNRSNEFDVTQTDRGINTQGLGLVYEEEFDNLNEFFCRVKQLFRKNDERIPCDE